MLKKDDISKAFGAFTMIKIPDFSPMVRVPLGTNSPVHFPAIIWCGHLRGSSISNREHWLQDSFTIYILYVTKL